MNDYSFGNFVCMLREKKGLTQAEIAQQLGVTPAAVSKWESGSSKPRVEVLFQLANILEVKPEELIAGHYIAEETLDPNVVRQINERYEYLRKIDSYATTNVKMRRLLAFIIDWNIVGFAVLLILTAYMIFQESRTAGYSDLKLLTVLFIMMLYPVLFIFRDFIMRGYSVGKRITGLIVLDKNTGKKAKAAKLIVRNIFLFLMQIDVVVLLISGASIGDRVAHTVVVLRKDLVNAEKTEAEPDVQRINSYVAPVPLTKKKVMIRVAIIVSVIVLFVALLLSIITTVLDMRKNTEEYKLAYNYLVESTMFDELDINEEKIKFRNYSGSSTYDSEGNVKKTAEFGFSLSGKRIYVTCHWENDMWYVCSACTGFD